MQLLTKNETALSAVITETAQTALNSAVCATSFQTALTAVLKITKNESK